MLLLSVESLFLGAFLSDLKYSYVLSIKGVIFTSAIDSLNLFLDVFT